MFGLCVDVLPPHGNWRLMNFDQGLENINNNFDVISQWKWIRQEEGASFADISLTVSITHSNSDSSSNLNDFNQPQQLHNGFLDGTSTSSIIWFEAIPSITFECVYFRFNHSTSKSLFTLNSTSFIIEVNGIQSKCVLMAICIVIWARNKLTNVMQCGHTHASRYTSSYSVEKLSVLGHFRFGLLW